MYGRVEKETYGTGVGTIEGSGVSWPIFGLSEGATVGAPVPSIGDFVLQRILVNERVRKTGMSSKTAR